MDASEAKPTQESMHAAALDVKAEQVQLQLTNSGEPDQSGVFTNASPKNLTIVVELSMATNGKQARFTLDIPAWRRKEIRPREGSQFARGDNTTASAADSKLCWLAFNSSMT